MKKTDKFTCVNEIKINLKIENLNDFNENLKKLYYLNNIDKDLIIYNIFCNLLYNEINKIKIKLKNYIKILNKINKINEINGFENETKMLTNYNRYVKDFIYEYICDDLYEIIFDINEGEKKLTKAKIIREIIYDFY